MVKAPDWLQRICCLECNFSETPPNNHAPIADNVHRFNNLLHEISLVEVCIVYQHRKTLRCSLATTYTFHLFSGGCVA
jgi:hypothetical protein